MAYGELVHTEEVKGVTYRTYIDQDDLSVRGNAVASGDDRLDKEIEDEILGRLDSGDVWAWASVTVEASFMGVTGEDHLGACSYANTADFCCAEGYYPDMKAQALDDLLAQCERASVACSKLRKLVKA